MWQYARPPTPAQIPALRCTKYTRIWTTKTKIFFSVVADFLFVSFKNNANCLTEIITPKIATEIIFLLNFALVFLF